MRIDQVVFAPGKSAFFFDDQRAIKGGAIQDGFMFLGEPVTDGFTRIRQAGECVSVIIMLENGAVAVGDCAAIQYSGAGGRDPLFLAETWVPMLEEILTPMLEGRLLEGFRGLADEIDGLIVDGRPLHKAVRYGISQALLLAQALAEGCIPMEIIAREWDLPLSAEPVPLFGQSGEDRYRAVDRMIIKEAAALPHGLINSPDTFGRKGECFAEYLRWTAERVFAVRNNEDYAPALHFDLYGMPGRLFGNDEQGIADYLASLEPAARGLDLYIEGPVDAEGREAQIDCLGRIKDALHAKGSRVRLVADEWCNTLEDVRLFTDTHCCHMVQIKTPVMGGVQNTVESVLYCNRNGMESYQGGTCNETDISSRLCAHLALATRPSRLLAKPGMGFDEGFSIVNNEMARAKAWLENRKRKTHETL